MTTASFTPSMSIMMTFMNVKDKKFPLIQMDNDHYRIVGSCSGVICVTDDQNHYGYATYLWNPSIHKCVVVPYANINFLAFGPYNQAVGFGYDATTGDYKVVRIVASCGFINQPLGVELYSMRTGVWRNISDLAQNIQCNVRPSCERARQAFLNGASHWIVKENSLSPLVILAFHYGDEVFRVMDSPVMTHQYFNIYWPTVVKGSLSLFQRVDGMCFLWVMNEYGDSGSWTRQWNITIHPQIGRIFGFRNEGQFLVEVKENLYSFDPNKGSDFLDRSNCWLQDLGLRSRMNFGRELSFHSESYTESLALLGAPLSVGYEELERLREEWTNRFRKLCETRANTLGKGN